MDLYTFRTIVEPEEGGGYHGFVPLLNGLHTYGDSLDEIKLNLKDAIKCHIQGLLKDNEQIPQEEEAFAPKNQNSQSHVWRLNFQTLPNISLSAYSVAYGKIRYKMPKVQNRNTVKMDKENTQ